MNLKLFTACFLIALMPLLLHAQSSDQAAIQRNEAFRDSLNLVFQNQEETPLTPTDFENFSELDFFPINLDYRIKAEFKRTPNQDSFKMATTTDEFKTYEKFGELHLQLNGNEAVLNVYQSHKLRETEEYANYLFLPFRDKTNGSETYGGGRYMELWIPESNEVIIDFNQAYNPYCVYNVKYSCPLVPKENWLSFPIYAGVKDFEKE